MIPSKIFESMGMGLPILLAAPEGECSRIVRNWDCGICVDPEAPQTLASAAGRLQHDPGLCNRLARNSLAAAPAFSREKQSAEMLRVLEWLCRIEKAMPLLGSVAYDEGHLGGLAPLARKLESLKHPSPSDRETSTEKAGTLL